MALPTIAIVGRPNVGKSTLFNRIAGERISIVEDVEGVTRDRIYATAEWLNRKFSIIDTGGIDDVDAPFMEQIKHQAEIAMDEADVIVFVVSGKEGITDADEYVTRILYKTHKPVILAVNKVDNPEMRRFHCECCLAVRAKMLLHEHKDTISLRIPHVFPEVVLFL